MLKWKPQPDITTFELAQCMGLLIAQSQSRATTIPIENAFKNLPDEAKRHWVVVGEKAA